MKRGEIYWANLNPRSGSEQYGKRPVIIVSHDVFNESFKWHSIIVVPVSASNKQSRRGPTAIVLARGTAGLKQLSVALCHQVTTLDRSKINEKIGLLPSSSLYEVDQGLKIALSLE
ncbi:MAG: type II toxin-antitoxin system PemK/MazF family toxin [Bdellovibrio sp.]|nr:type II toxin-antitoxin system PemK/MazF family toxin [Bdellovibrio sp.]